MGKTIAIHQPNYIPWLGYFYKISQADIFVFLDDVQYSNKGMHNYSYIKTASGSFRLKYPVQQSLGDQILEVRSKDELGWKEKHFALLEANYRNAGYFELVFNDYKEIVIQNYPNIASMNIALITLFSEKLGIDTDFVKSSDLGVALTKTGKIIEICNKLGGSIYYSGTGAKAYQDQTEFRSSGIELRYSNFKSFEYMQLWEEFQSNVTALDYFMNHGYDWCKVLATQQY